MTPQHRFLDWLSESPIARAADVVVVSGGLTIYGWYPYLKQLSDVAALIVPLVTIFYMLTLAICHILKTIQHKE
jgi:hypothetical protein